MDPRIASEPCVPPRRALVTGGTSGIGRATALALAAAGWRVIIAGRREDALADTWAEINATAGLDACDTLRLDLADLGAVRAAAALLRDEGRPLDLLVCNAGIMAPPSRLKGAEGHELQLTVNHLAHYTLCAKLMPLLRLAPAGRVVWVSSVRHHAAPVGERTPWRPEQYDGRTSYATSKAWNLAFSLWLDNRLKADPSGVRSVAAHPGWSRTALHSRGPEADGGSARGRLQRRLTRVFGQSAIRGAISVLAAAQGPLEDRPTYLGPSGPFELWGRGHRDARVSALAADGAWQSWVAARSAELTRTALPG